MIRVLIADDEELIRKLIKRLVDWDALGMEVVAEAGDGYTAYNLMVEYEPDIVIADIRMPGIDGLNLARKIHKINPNIAFMLVSGYQEFEYAQEALKLCIKDYILKMLSRGNVRFTVNSKTSINKAAYCVFIFFSRYLIVSLDQNRKMR